MGQGIIQSGGKGGYYSIEIVKNLTTATKRKAAIATRIASFVILIATATTELETAQAALATAKTTLQTKILLANPEEVVKAQAAVVLAQGTVNTKKLVLDSLKLEQESLNKEKALLDVKASKELAGVWCADLSERLSRTVGTLEINGEAGKTKRILIMPGGAAGVGKIEPSENSTPAGVFYNWAVFPAWQKVKPTYRTGVLTAINFTANTCTVSLDPALSSVQSFNINQAVVLTGVPIVYMTCHAGAFVVGDAVVVKFEGQLQATPKVIGFVSDPKGCGWRFTLPTPMYITPGFVPEAGVYAKIGGELTYVDSTHVWDYVTKTITINPLFTYVPDYANPTVKATLPDNTPLYFKPIDSYFACLQTFPTYAELLTGGAVPPGRYNYTQRGYLAQPSVTGSAYNNPPDPRSCSGTYRLPIVTWGGLYTFVRTFTLRIAGLTYPDSGIEINQPGAHWIDAEANAATRFRVRLIGAETMANGDLDSVTNLVLSGAWFYIEPMSWLNMLLWEGVPEEISFGIEDLSPGDLRPSIFLAELGAINTVAPSAYAQNSIAI